MQFRLGTRLLQAPASLLGTPLPSPSPSEEGKLLIFFSPSGIAVADHVSRIMQTLLESEFPGQNVFTFVNSLFTSGLLFYSAAGAQQPFDKPAINIDFRETYPNRTPPLTELPSK